MPKPRKSLISLETTPYYHCVSRCVRRAFLCGEDPATGKNFEHRRHWIRDKQFELATIFAIDVCAYSVMNNHYHLVLYIDRKKAERWCSREVIERWQRLFRGSSLSQRFLKGESLSIAEQSLLSEQVMLWRTRLMEISWFMRCLNESVARDANREDDCTGRFWEGRFKSQALLDEKALAACMAYVDFNPVRAGMVQSLEEYEFTSIAERAAKAETTAFPDESSKQPPHLLPFVGNPREEMPKGLPFRLTDYLELLNWTEQAMFDSRQGFIPARRPPILERLQIDTSHWLYMTQHFESKFKGLVGAAYRLKAVCLKLGYRRIPSITVCQRLLT
ncbi:MAG: transposase [Candidatus Thiodiazotropha sp. (ex Epidulcina cf. delphinae)]|nr:transposase [Candidatus Thiodiazotropha sp. (ex Epidulcina cf. delphinae)]